MSNEQTAVMFRRWKRAPYGIIALFPDEIADHDGNVMSYEHVGQHGAADYSGVMKLTTPALPTEYHALFNELQNAVGYRLHVVMSAAEAARMVRGATRNGEGSGAGTKAMVRS